MTQSWRIAPGAAPALRKWGDEYVVHHALSNDTYRLSATAGRILTELVNADGQSASETGSWHSLGDAETGVALAALAELGFVVQC